MTQLIVGLGTGRCGTRSLAKLLALQPGANVEHEREPFLPWEGEADPSRHLRKASDDDELFADVGFYYLPYVRGLMQEFPDLKFICLRRNRQKTIESFCAQLPRSTYWFSDRDDGWSRAFPDYNLPFEEAVKQYWEDYYAEAESLECNQFRIFPTALLNTRRGVKDILAFAGIDQPEVETGILVADVPATN